MTSKSAIFHINPETGNPGKCSAQEGNCPFGGEHYGSEDTARKAFEAQQSLEKAFGTNPSEPLLEELELWISPGPLGRFLNHPLVQDLMVDVAPGLANQRFLQKKKLAENAYEKQDWNRYVFLHERPFRAETLYELYSNGENISPELVADVWIDSENIWQNREAWDEILTELHENNEHIGENLEELPDSFTVYRGCSAENEEGLSWTTDKEKAEWFAERFESDSPTVLQMEVSKKSIVGYLTRRGESEIIIAPSELSSLLEKSSTIN